MLEKLYLASLGCIAFIEVIKPVYGICFLCLLFFLQPQQFFPDTMSYHPALNLAIILFFSTFLRCRDFRKKKFIILSTLFVGLCFLSSVINGEGVGAILMSYCKSILFATIILSFINSRKDFMLLVYSCILGGLCNSVYAICEQFAGFAQTYDTPVSRSIGLWGDPNTLSALLIVLIPVAYYLFFNAGNKFQRCFYFLTIFLFVS